MISTVITGLIMMGKRKVAMEVLTPKLVKLWKDWELRALVLTSLLVQIILILLGSRRKYIPKMKIRAIVWCSYVLADPVASIALGILTKNLGDIYDVGGVLDLNTRLTAFWAPFLLLHLGGPDTITAYALEDNQLWLRHFFGLITQTAVALYIFQMAWSDSRLSLLSIPMIVVGLIKYGEKTWTLWKASSDQLRDSMLASLNPGNDHSKLMNEYKLKQAEGYFLGIEEVMNVEEVLDVSAPAGTTPDGKNIIKAHALFQTFKCLFADLILSFKEREKSQYLFRDEAMSYENAFEVVAIELGFLYDMLYTKATVVYTRWGLARRITTVCLTCLVLVIFCFEDLKKYKKADIFITFLLLVVAIFLEICAALALLLSDKTYHWLIKHNKTKVLRIINSLPPFLKPKRWSSQVQQLSLLNICLKEKSRLKQLQKVVEKFSTETYAKVDDNLKKLIFEHVKGESDKFKERQDDAHFRDSWSKRGYNILESYNKQQTSRSSLEWSINVEFDQSILIWHIATELCYFGAFESISSNSVQLSREVSKCISNYMICLLVMYPFLLPIGIGFIRFQETLAEAKSFFEQRSNTYTTEEKNPNDRSNRSKSFKSDKKMINRCKLLLKDNIDVLPREAKGYSSKSVLSDARRLALTLNDIKDEKWDMIRDIWLEMLIYAASHSKGSQHCQQLRRGGELITHVWLLMAHFGINEQFQISEINALLSAK